MKKLTAAVVAAVLGAGPLRAGYGDGSGGAESGAAFLRINPSVRGEALGGLNPAAAAGASGMGVNPSALAGVEGRELTSAFATMMGGSQYGHVAFGAGRGRSAVGASVTFLRSEQLQGRDAAGAPTADFRAQDMAAGLTMARAWGESFQAGITGKVLRQEIGAFKSKPAFAGDAGLGFRTGAIGWGLSALNMGAGIDFEGRKRSLPAVYALGVSVPLGGGMTALAGGAQSLGETTATMGLEYSLRTVNLRVGYRSGGSSLARRAQKSSEQALGGLTGGIGISVKNFRIDYAVSQAAVEWGMGHRASVTFKWGGEPAAAPARKAAPKPAKAAAPRARPAAKPAPGVTTGSRQAYDAKPIIRKKKKTWVH